MADVEIDQDTLDWMRSLYRESRSKTKALPEPSAKRSAKKDRALALLARGYTQQRVAIMVGAAPVTVSGWAKQAREEGSREV